MEEDTRSDEDEFILCDTCDILFRSAKSYLEHRRGSKHLKKLKDLRNRSVLKNSAAAAADGDGDSSKNEAAATEEGECDHIECQVCEKTFSGILSLKQHLKSAPHAKAMKRERLLNEVPKPGSGLDVELEPDANLDDGDIIPKPFASCPTCKKEFSGPESYRDHMISKQHVKKVKETKLLKLLKESSSLPGSEGDGDTGMERQIEILKKQLFETAETALSNEEDSSDKTYFCEQCGKSFSGPVPLLQHLVSKIHKKKLKQVQILNKLKEKMAQDDDHSEEETTSEEDEEEVLACITCGMTFSGPESMMAHLKGKTHKNKVAFKKAKSKKTLETPLEERSVGTVGIESYSQPHDEAHGPVKIEKEQAKHPLKKFTGSKVIYERSTGMPLYNPDRYKSPESLPQMPGSPKNSETQQYFTDTKAIVTGTSVSSREKIKSSSTTSDFNPSTFEIDHNSISVTNAAVGTDEKIFRKRSNLEKVAGAVSDIIKEI